MSLDPELHRLLASMVERDVSLEVPGFHVDRARVLARMAQASVPERRGWGGAVALAVACAVVLGMGARLWTRGETSVASLEVLVSEGSASQVRGAARSEVAPRQSAHIAADGELETAAASQARVRTADGLEIELHGRTRVALNELRARSSQRSSQVKLLGGAIRCTVPHRKDEQAFRVVTSDATIVDLGTVFTVSVEGWDGATRVSVEEGEVLVRHAGDETRVRAPGTWSSAVDLPEPAHAASPPRAPAVPPPSSRGTRALARTPRGAEAAAGTLDAESRLLRDGLTAERQGRSAEAIVSLRRLVATYPRSPLVTDARAALTRIEAGARQ